jgi:hypothetical protein
MKAGVQLRLPALVLAAASAVDRSRLANLGLDLTEHGGPGFVEAVLHSAVDESVLQAAGFSWKVTIPDLAVRQKQNNDLSAAYAAATVKSPLTTGDADAEVARGP